MTESIDSQIRLNAFQFLDEQTRIHGDVLSRTDLRKGFEYQGQQIHLMGPQGIFKPAILDLPLTFNMDKSS